MKGQGQGQGWGTGEATLSGALGRMGWRKEWGICCHVTAGGGRGQRRTYFSQGSLTDPGFCEPAAAWSRLNSLLSDGGCSGPSAVSALDRLPTVALLVWVPQRTHGASTLLTAFCICWQLNSITMFPCHSVHPHFQQIVFGKSVGSR